MKLSEMKLPFKAVNGMVWDAAMKLVASCNDNSIEICSILNAHFQPKEEPKPHQPDSQDACHHGVQEWTCGVCNPAKTVRQPQPNREETDKIAAKYYESGRKLDIQCWSLCAGGAKGYWKDVEFPSFSYDYAWHIKPTKRRVVVEVYRDSTSAGRLRSVCVGSEDASQLWTLVGTAECEVEA